MLYSESCLSGASQSVTRRMNAIQAQIMGVEGSSVDKNLIARMQVNASDRYVEDEESSSSILESQKGTKFFQKALKLANQTAF